MSSCPGDLFNPRPLPRPPKARAGFFHALGKLLGGGRRVTDLREELLQASVAFRSNQPAHARFRLKRTLENLEEIDRDGSQFVLTHAEWQSILDAANQALHSAEHARAEPALLALAHAVNLQVGKFGGRRE